MITTMMARGQFATYLPTGELCKIEGRSNAGYFDWRYSLKSEIDGRELTGVSVADLKRVSADVLPFSNGEKNAQ